MPLLIEVGAKILLLVLALGVLLWRTSSSSADAAGSGSTPAAKRAQLGVLVLGLLTYTNWGSFHEHGSFAHDWDQYHYVVSSKYFPELGYDGLYVATALAAEQLDEPVPPRIRDLRSQRVVDYAEIGEHQLEVRARFDDARWRAFVADIDTLEIHPWAYTDHGYNAPPTLTAVLRTLTTWIPVAPASLDAYALLDTALLFGCVLVIAWAFGLERAAACSLLLGLSFVARYFWNGGSILRYDWLLATTCALALLERERPGWAGLALGYAAAVRVFPALLALPVLAHYGVRAASDPGQRRALTRFVAGLALAGSLLGVFGAAANGRGPQAYVDIYAKLAEHDAAPPPNNVGMRTLLITSAANLDGALVEPESIYETNEIAADYVAHSEARRVAIHAAGLACLVFALIVGARAATPVIAALSGLLAVFGLSALTCYYWVTLMLLPLWSRERGLLWGLSSNLAMYAWAAFALFMPVLGLVERFNGALVFLPCAVIVLALLVACAIETLGGRGGSSPAERGLDQGLGA